MRKIAFLILVINLQILAVAHGQKLELSPEMAAFKQYCLDVRHGVEARNSDILIDCISNWTPADKSNEEHFEYNGEKINYSSFNTLTCVDTTSEVPLGLHLRFLPAYIDTLIANNFEAVAVAEAHILRADEKHVEYIVRALAPKSSATYATNTNNDIELFAVAENGGKLKLSARTMECNFKHEIINETTHSSPEGESAQLIFHIDRCGELEFTIENTSDEEISFIVVKKL
ncbi:MAG: hypothetical protein IKR94_05405 [Bacteroidales bacterium]|nr:hypothetical protein [Bacteroidales bacterium]